MTTALAPAARHPDPPQAGATRPGHHHEAWPASGTAPGGHNAGPPPPLRVEVTQIHADGAMRRQRIDTAGAGGAGCWQQLIARALAAPAPYRPVPGSPLYHLRLGERDLLVADHDLCGPLLDLVTAILAFGQPI